MEKKFVRKPSVEIYYIIGFIWLLFACTIGIYKLTHYVLLVILSIAAYYILNQILPPEEIEIRPQEVESKDSYCAVILKDGYAYKEQVSEYKIKVEDPILINQLEEIESYTDKMFQQISKQVEKSREVRKFINYYFPTLLSLLKAYDDLENEHSNAKVFQDGMKKVSDAMPLIVKAFQEQYEALFSDKVLDINANINVMQTMLKQDGIVDEFNGGNKHEQGK